MRNLDERMAEISRRSDIIFKQRKRRRNHIIMACIPLVLCISLYTAFILPTLLPTEYYDQESTNDDRDHLFSADENSTVIFAGSVEVSGMGISNYYDSSDDVTRIMSLINGIIAIPETSNDEISDFVTNEESSAIQDESFQENGYTIIVKSGDGMITEYYLLGSSLTNRNTQESFTMSEDEYFALKDALGIPFY